MKLIGTYKTSMVGKRGVCITIPKQANIKPSTRLSIFQNADGVLLMLPENHVVIEIDIEKNFKINEKTA